MGKGSFVSDDPPRVVGKGSAARRAQESLDEGVWVVVKAHLDHVGAQLTDLQGKLGLEEPVLEAGVPGEGASAAPETGEAAPGTTAGD